MPDPTALFLCAPTQRRRGFAALFWPRTSLVGRATLIILLLGCLLSGLFILGGVHVIRQQEVARQLRYTEGLVTAVESTMRIACFAKDRPLAAELGQGLMTNEAIAGVRIVSGNEVLVEMYKGSGPPAGATPWVQRVVTSPFKTGQAIGEIEVFVNHFLVDKRAQEHAIWLAVALFASALATTIAVALVVFTKIVRPIGALADNLRHLPARAGGLVPLPPGHEENELGQLTQAFNALLADQVALLREEELIREQLALSERNFRTLAEHSPDCIVRYDNECRLTYVNPLCRHAFGAPDGEPGGKMPQEIFSNSSQYADYRAHLESVIHSGVPNDLEMQLTSRQGEARHYHIRFVAEHDERGHIVGALAIGRDVTQSKEIEQELLRQATHDALTGLPNRLLLKDRLSLGLAQARRHGRRLAVIFIDLDNFKDVNDSLGHEAGDQLLKLVATRMRNILREGDTVARQGGDEFVVLIEDAGDNRDIETIMSKLFNTLAAPCDIAGRRIYPGASLGVAVYPDDADDADTLMRNADTAMYAAKSEGRRHYRFFSPDMDRDLQAMMELNSALHQALERREFSLHYQPKVALADGRLVGMEALIRWHRPDQGFVSPAVFVPLAEKNGLIDAIGHWVLDEACRQTREWLDAGLDPGKVAVNLSAVQCQSAGLAALVRMVLANHGVPGERLEVEITESQVMTDSEHSIATLWALRELGVSLAVDDFGTGYSSLAYLKRLPVNTLKIDKSFIDEVAEDRDDLQIVRTIVAMAHGLELQVVAEGVETEAQRQRLIEVGCDLYQGYYFSRPLPAGEMARLLHWEQATPSPA